MFDEIKINWNRARIRQLTDIRNLAFFAFSILALAVTWSGIKTVQNNYELQKKIAALQQQNAVTSLQNENINLQNKYLQTNEYLDVAARQNLGLAAPGETVMRVPKSVALKYVDPSLAPRDTNDQQTVPDKRSKYVKNMEAWRDFLLGRTLSGD
jgi:cell division protein FtsB